MSQLDYKFAPVPNKLMRCLDVNCRSMLFALVDLNSILANDDGWFFRSNADLQIDADLSENLVRATLDTLYQAGIINIYSVGQGNGHKCNRIHINFESFVKYERYSFNDIRFNPDLKIKTVPYKNHYKPSYLGNEIGKEQGKKVSTNIDTLKTGDTLYTKETLNTKEIKELNNIEYYLLDFLDNPTKDYRCLLDNLPYFQNRNYSDLMILQENLKNKCNCEYSLEDIINNLQFLYKEKTGYRV